jgi:hypothetical protein
MMRRLLEKVRHWKSASRKEIRPYGGGREGEYSGEGGLAFLYVSWRKRRYVKGFLKKKFCLMAHGEGTVPPDGAE